METYLDVIDIAQKKCWVHMEVATKMVDILNALRGIRMASATPLISDILPTLIVTPEYPDDVAALRFLCSKIKHALNADTEWLQIPVSDNWYLRLEVPGRINIDVMTRIPAYKEVPISL